MQALEETSCIYPGFTELSEVTGHLKSCAPSLIFPRACTNHMYHVILSSMYQAVSAAVYVSPEKR